MISRDCGNPEHITGPLAIDILIKCEELVGLLQAKVK